MAFSSTSGPSQKPADSEAASVRAGPSSAMQQPHLQPANARPKTTSGQASPAMSQISHARRGSRRPSLPFAFPLLSPPHTSSTSLFSSTAEGRPIPIDDSTTEHRTSALRELNRSQPVSRQRYAGSGSGAPSISTTTGTYSQPVIVRTYSGPRSSNRGRSSGRRVPLGPVTVTPNSSSSSTASNWRAKGGFILNMGRRKGAAMAANGPQDAKLPPMEAFSFKGMMADMEQNVDADLDRIAEICARSRYSLSNQYEVHVQPHGSGAAFVSPASASISHKHGGLRGVISGGPTLQIVSSDDERRHNRYRRRRGGMRRRSAAYGTLETIMSSSRSSEEGKGKKKSAAELTEEVRGRATTGSSAAATTVAAAAAAAAAQTSPAPASASATLDKDRGNSAKGASGTDSEPASEQPRTPGRRKSSSFATALMDSSRSQTTPHRGGDGAAAKAAGAALVSEPAQPQASGSHLEIRTTTSEDATSSAHEQPQQTTPHPSKAVVSQSVASASIVNPEQASPTRGASFSTSGSPYQPGLLSGLSSWVPWRVGAGAAVTEVAKSGDAKERGGKSYAEGTLRDLLKTNEPPTTDAKGKGVARTA